MFTIIWLNTSRNVYGAWVCQNQKVYEERLENLRSQSWMKIINAEPSLYFQQESEHTMMPDISDLRIRNIKV